MDYEEIVDDYGQDAVDAFVSNFGYPGKDDKDLVEEYFEDAFSGEYSNKEDWCAEFLDDTGGLDGVPENLKAYFDYKAYVRDLEMGGDFAFVDGYVFNAAW